MSAQREMTLQEWVDKLPGIHSAHKEFDSLQGTIAQQAERIAELEDFVRDWLSRQGTDDNYMTSKARAALATQKGQK